MKFAQLTINDVILLTPQVYEDSRGFFLETFRDDEFRQQCGQHTFVQDNHSRSTKHTLRGLHYQLERPQGKLVRVISGSVFDVAVDLRISSPTFGKWVGAVLSDDNRQMLWVPPGFAHGFYVISDTVDLVYKCTDYYLPEFDRSLLWSDAHVGIEWPLAAEGELLLSKKDATAPCLSEASYYD